MPEIKMAYPLVALEGTDGSGKSTLRRRLGKAFRDAGFEASEFGQHSWLIPEVSRIIVGTRLGRSSLPPAQVVRSYLRDKSEHYVKNIAPALQSGFAIVDRYVLSDLVYHNVLHQVPVERIQTEMGDAKLAAPDVIVFVDTPPDVAWQRIQSRAKELRPYEREKIIHDLYQGYLDVLTMKVVDSHVIRFPNAGELTQEAVQGLVADVVGYQQACAQGK
jgi:dTMP kinase